MERAPRFLGLWFLGFWGLGLLGLGLGGLGLRGFPRECGRPGASSVLFGIELVFV